MDSHNGGDPPFINRGDRPNPFADAGATSGAGFAENEADIDEGEVSTDSSNSDIRRGPSVSRKTTPATTPGASKSKTEPRSDVLHSSSNAISVLASGGVTENATRIDGTKVAVGPGKSLLNSNDDDDDDDEEEDEDNDAMAIDARASSEKAARDGDRSRPSSQNSNDFAVESKESGDNDSKADLPYSTRGRSVGSDQAGGGSGEISGGEGSGDPWDRNSSRDLTGDSARPKETSATPPVTSFLESLSEEERRTRTRILPDVEGIHMLRKNEIKRDMLLARSIATGGGITNLVSMRKNKNKRARIDSGDMEVDDDTGSSSPEDEVLADTIKTGATTIHIGANPLAIPSHSFVESSKPTHTISITSDPATNPYSNKIEIMSPSIVETVNAFNPPRPPESIGTKKKHRMLRWERRPEDVEVDLGNYRKTVQRTRQELHSAEAERDRLQTIDAHLRRHFLNHLRLLGGEHDRLDMEMFEIQDECVKAADVVTSRTRSRGAGMNTQVMRDVISVLKSNRGMGQMSSATSEPKPVGAGGLTQASFVDWDQSTTFSPAKLANSWVTKGDKVQTPYGVGETVSVIFSEYPKSFEANEVKQSVNAADMTSSDLKAARNGNIGGGISFGPVLPPRVCVKLPFGVGFFNLKSVSVVEDAAKFSDSRLMIRWTGMINSLSGSGSFLDIEANNLLDKQVGRQDSSDINDDVPMDDSSVADMSPGHTKGDVVMGATDLPQQRLLPFASELLPTSQGRGAHLSEITIRDLEQGVRSALFEGASELSKTSNDGVPTDVKDWEEQQQEYYTLQARALQLRNELTRQKRIRFLNERTFATTRDRSFRAQGLVAEMRADLQSLKNRLQEELNELGIDEATASATLSAYYRDQKSRSAETDPTQKPEIVIPTTDELGVVSKAVVVQATSSS